MNHAVTIDVLANDYVIPVGMTSAAATVVSGSSTGDTGQDLTFADGSSYDVFARQTMWTGTLGNGYTWLMAELPFITMIDTGLVATITWGGEADGTNNQFSLFKNGIMVAVGTRVTYQSVTDKVPESPTFKLEADSIDVDLIALGSAGIDAIIPPHSHLHIGFGLIDGLYDEGDPPPVLEGSGGLTVSPGDRHGLEIAGWQTSADTHGTVDWNGDHTQLVYTPDTDYVRNPNSSEPKALFTYTIAYNGVVLGHAATVLVDVKFPPLPELLILRLNNDTGLSQSDQVSRDPTIFYSTLPDPQPVATPTGDPNFSIQIDVGCDGIIDFNLADPSGIVDIKGLLPPALTVIEVQARTYRAAANGQPEQTGAWVHLVFQYVVGNRAPIGCNQTYQVRLGDTLSINDPLVGKQRLLSDASDPDGDNFEVFSADGERLGTFAMLDYAKGTFTYTAPDDIDLNRGAEDVIKFVIVDLAAEESLESNEYTLTIKLLPGVNRPPEFEKPTYKMSIPANYLMGDVIPAASDPRDLASDPDAEAVTYSIDPSTNADGMFEIDNTSWATIKLSKDAIQATQPEYVVTLIATDVHGATSSADLVIKIQTVVGIVADRWAVEGQADKIVLTFVRYAVDLTESLEVAFFMKWAASTELNPSVVSEAASIEAFVDDVERQKLVPEAGGVDSYIIIPEHFDRTSITLTAKAGDEIEGIQSFAAITLRNKRLPEVSRYILPNRMLADDEPGNFKDEDDHFRVETAVRCYILEGVTPFGKFVDSTLTTTDPDDVDINDVKQGGVGDCFLMSAFIALAKDNPDFLRQMFHANPNASNEYLINLRNDQDPSNDEHVSLNLTRGSNSANPTGDCDANGNSEIWVILLEAAYSQSLPGDGGYSNIDGGNIRDAWMHLTGKNAVRSDVSTQTSEQIRDQLIAASNAGKIVAFGTEDVLDPYPSDGVFSVNDPTEGHVLYGNHTYVVLEVFYEDVNGTNTLFVRVANPLTGPQVVRYDVFASVVQNLYQLDSTR